MEQNLLKSLRLCRNVSDLKQIHLQCLVHGLKDNDFVVPKLISRSAELHSMEYSLKLFDTAQIRNVVAYNTMIECFIGKFHGGALRIYNQMKASMVWPNSYTFRFVLRCLESAVKDGMAIHGDIVKLGFCSSVFVQNVLLGFYAKCGGNLRYARKVFDEMPERDVVSWNSMIGVYMSSGEIKSAMRLFESMPERSIVTWNSVVSGLCRAGIMDLARSVFESMPERNEVSWNSILSGYINVGDLEAAHLIFDQMPAKNVVSWTALISGYTMVGDTESARYIFDKMPIKNVVSWNAMIACYVHNHKFDEALSLFQQMLIDNKYKPDQATLLSVLSACSHLGSLEHGKWIDSFIKKNRLDLSVPLGNVLIDMYAKCGDVENANAVFNKMESKCIITWTSMISGLAVNGQCTYALDLFDKMCRDGIKPDEVIFVAVLTACSHAGLVSEGKRVFKQMVVEFNIEPRIEHYGCMVDLLGRAGRLEEAIGFVESMHLKPNAVIWATLLSSCMIHKKGDLLEFITKKILDQEPSNPGYLTLISNLSALIGQKKNSSDFLMAMRQQGLEKVPGCSSIQLGNHVHEFLARDTRHAQRKEIYSTLYSLNGHIKPAVAKMSQILYSDLQNVE